MSCVLVCGAVLAEPTSANNQRLRRALSRFPNADSNRDGVLTLDEARQFRDRHKKRDSRPPSQSPEDAIVHRDLRYGPHERNVLDLYVPKAATSPAPLVVFIHGGGFIDGDKANLLPGMLERCIEHRLAVAALNYRFITTDPFPAPLHDCARAIQFLRANAGEYGLDKGRFAVYGGSAGGGAALWLALHNDLADPGNEDPVLRESSRVCAAGAIRGQTTYNPLQLREWLGDIVLQHRSVLPLYGANNVQELLEPTPERLRLFEECSPIHHVSMDDPPVILFYTEYTPPDVGGAIHSKIFGEKLKTALDDAGVYATLDTSMRDTSGEGIVDPLCDFFMAAFSGDADPAQEMGAIRPCRP